MPLIVFALWAGIPWAIAGAAAVICAALVCAWSAGRSSGRLRQVWFARLCAFGCAIPPMLNVGPGDSTWLMVAAWIFAIAAVAQGIASRLAPARQHAAAVPPPPTLRDARSIALHLGITVAVFAQSWLLIEVSPLRYSNLRLAIAADHAGIPLLTEGRYASELLRTVYWWRDHRPAPFVIFGDPAEVLAAARAPQDKWSAILTREVDARSRDNRAANYGLRLGRGQDDRLMVRDVIPNSPAERDGARRGDRVVAMNGQPPTRGSIKTLTDAPPDTAIALDIDTVDGRRLRLFWKDGEEYPTPPVTDTRVLPEQEGRRVAYLQLRGFDQKSAEDFTQLVDEFRRQKINDLVIDLRNNPGGTEYSVNAIASRIAGAAVDGQVAYRKQYHRGLEEVEFDSQEFQSLARHQRLGLERVHFLIGSSTCSASEALIAMLQPHMRVATFGDKTCGKTYMARTHTYRNHAYHVVTGAMMNEKWELMYPGGIVATCNVKDEFMHGYGDPREPLLAAALDYMRSGQCPRIEAHLP
ncbi:MAG: S41 family peptidase [Sulfuritalea sp.]|nr:S41 family peptidase [Sulfuritalea sp.]